MTFLGQTIPFSVSHRFRFLFYLLFVVFVVPSWLI